MRKIFLFMMVSADGYFEGLNHELNWHNVDKEFNTFAIQQLDESDLLVFGHRTYTMMADFWSSEKAKKSSSETATRMNGMNKIVFSHTPFEVNWEHTELKTSVNAEEIRKLKEQPGKDIAILGSSNLCLSFLAQGLLDEVRLMINPVLLGEGNILFNGLHQKIKLKLEKTRNFNSGNILLYYQVLQ